MNQRENHPQLLTRSERWYRRLLILYPRGHRNEYGPAMLQLFRDQCCDAWRESRGRGLLLLWLRILPDLLKTSLLEHLSRLKGKSMSKKFFPGPRASAPVLSAFLIVGVITFFAVVMLATVVTFIMPETYASRAVIKIEGQTDVHTSAEGSHDPYWTQTEFEFMQSEIILDRVIEKLGLNERWQKEFGSPDKFTTAKSRAVLRSLIDLQPSRNPMLVNINVYSKDRREAADIANAMAEVYRDYRRAKHAPATSQTVGGGEPPVEIIEHAEPGFRPIRPNKPLNIFLGVVLGGMLGVFMGGIAALCAWRSQNNAKSPPPLPQAASAG